MLKKILVIENIAETRNMFLESLNEKGFHTISAQDGLTGVQRAQEELPDLIISEILLPKIDGYSILTQLRENPHTAIIPLIFVTTQESRADIRKAIEMGADDYLIKPCTVEELLGAITACLQKRAFLQQYYTAKSQLVAKPAFIEAIRHKCCSEEPPRPTSKPPLIENSREIDLESIFPYDPDLMEVFHFIEANFHRPITLSDVADAVGYSSAYLTNWVRRQTGQTVQNWIILRRMAAARLLLLKTNQAVEEIATKVGYQSVVHFFRQFRKYHGTTPQAWRKLQLAKDRQDQQNC
jgi:YesN/AraC family two-component response regulator